MIVVVGNPAWQATGPTGRAAEIALAAAGRGRAVELVGRTGDDPAGDRLVLALARAGVGHVALLRDPARPTPIVAPPAETEGPADAEDEALDADRGAEDRPGSRGSEGSGPTLDAADVSLGLQYLTAFDVLVVADDVPAAAVPVALEAAAFAGARAVLLLPADAADAPPVAGDATVLAAPAGTDDGAFAGLVGAYAAGLDEGADPAAAFARAVEDVGWETLPAEA